MKGKYWRGSVITTGGKEEAFCDTGYNRYPLSEILQPFELTAALCQMQWIDHWYFTGPEMYRRWNVTSMPEVYRRWLNDPLGTCSIEIGVIWH